jgi:16S rRNA (cytosine967-C5)-methyltransferase
VNAVLRRLSQSESPDTKATERDATVLAAEYSHPLWLVQRWIESFGRDGTEGLLQWNNSRPRLVLQPARADLEALRTNWRTEGIEVEDAPYGAGLITNRSRPDEHPGYREGHFMVQDPAQALLAQFADLPAGVTLYDACAAPGGKTIALGRRSGRVVAGEVSPGRARRLAENVARAGSGREHVIIADARQPPLRAVDVVLLDAPCLGTGTFGRHPDARWRVSLDALTALQRLQAELLDRTAGLVRPGGLLVYSTCSLEPEENEAQVDSFLARNSEFRRDLGQAVPRPLLSSKGDLMILPQHHGMDGAYAARLRRSA